MKGRSASRAIEAAFWQHVDVLDEFWLELFPVFIAPLQGIFADATSAGATVLSRYLEHPAITMKELIAEPEKFGHVEEYPRLALADAVAQLTKGDSGVSLAQCAIYFNAAHEANRGLDKIRAADPRIFATLQQERVRRHKPQKSPR